MEPARNNRIDQATKELVAELDSAHAAVTRSQHRLLQVVARCLVEEPWKRDGAQDLAEWLSGRLGISKWAARRWINAAVTLPHLPRVSGAFEAGRLGLDKVVELCRFATPDTEPQLIPWARRVTVKGVRHEADIANRPPLDQVAAADRQRFVEFWCSDEHTLELHGTFGAAEGATVTKALDRLAARMPDILDCDCAPDAGCRCPRPDQELGVRRADALVALASIAIADDRDPDRATVVVHADVGALAGDDRGCEIEHGPVIHPETARRLACDSRLQVVLHEGGNVVGIGRAARTVPPWLLRQLRYRDRGCTFRGCGKSWFLHAHHIQHWIQGGPTNLDNLVLLCSFHHKLVHEHRWRVELDAGGVSRWFRPDATEIDPGPDEVQADVLGRAPPTALLPT